ncbi:KdsC family phosphatase [Candidatus Uabimicrobium amorphum]|uniref:Haloacid dehalogenase n=1 Tax=Uabimicrobium amorphum TaxID=2596890 RepID=A0A5S9IP81_UABAM|nr:HAD-IIIA family hydrolase [Candidatus Uabimicrobium amorphum]BBM84165.1 haloacid dehalogenase [Candidatus Uabimicrobium amorphum]
MACKIVLLDVDGVLTDGSIYIDKNGDEFKRFNVKDGLGIKRLQQHGIEVGVITGRSSLALYKRLEKLGVTLIYDNISEKLPVYEQILIEKNISDEEACYMGDDLPDIPILQRVKIAGCPADAVDEVHNVCQFKSKREGGRGAVREFAEFILQQN